MKRLAWICAMGAAVGCGTTISIGGSGATTSGLATSSASVTGSGGGAVFSTSSGAPSTTSSGLGGAPTTTSSGFAFGGAKASSNGAGGSFGITVGFGGATGVGASATSSSSGGLPTTLVPSNVKPGCIAIGVSDSGASAIFFIDTASEELMQVPVLGGTPTAMAPTGQTQGSICSGITVVPNGLGHAEVYWLRQEASGGTVSGVPMNGNTAITLATGQNLPIGCWPYSDQLAWFNQGTAQDQFNDGALMNVPLFGGGPTQQIAPAPGHVTSFVVWPDNDVIWSSLDGKIRAAPGNGIAPGTMAEVLVSTSNLGAITSDDNNLYWADTAGHRIMKVPIAGGSPTVLATDTAGPDAIVTDGVNVYWFGSALQKVPIGGGPTTVLAGSTLLAGPPAEVTMLGIGGYIYWIDASGALWAVAMM